MAGGMDVLLIEMVGQFAAEGKLHPEKHADLIVRVAGFSAYFVDLTQEIQNDIIRRVEQTF